MTSSIQCFASNLELRNAVLEYVKPGVSSNPSSDIAKKYGWPINTWCVSNVTDFSSLFIPPDSNDISTLFNEDISDWDMSNAINVSSMFEGAYAFNQSLDTWNVSNVQTMDRMFYRAFSFRQNLCPWGTLLLQEMGTTNQFSAKDAFLDTGCSNENDPTIISSSGFAGPFCFSCNATSTNSTTSAPTTSPATTDPPSKNVERSGECFQSKVDLDLAVAQYLIDTSSTTDIARRYGWPMNNWCVSNVTDFSRLFSPLNNLDKASFNEDVSRWDMSNAITVESMFERNLFFNQDISNWTFGTKLQSTYRMFYGSKSFNQNLCSWGRTSANMNNVFTFATTNVTQMFRDTACPTVQDPIYNYLPQPGPFCYECTDTDDDKPTSSPIIGVVPTTISPPSSTKPVSAPQLLPSRQPVSNNTPPEPNSSPMVVVVNTTRQPTAAPVNSNNDSTTTSAPPPIFQKQSSARNENQRHFPTSILVGIIISFLICQ